MSTSDDNNFDDLTGQFFDDSIESEGEESAPPAEQGNVEDDGAEKQPDSAKDDTQSEPDSDNSLTDKEKAFLAKSNDEKAKRQALERENAELKSRLSNFGSKPKEESNSQPEPDIDIEDALDNPSMMSDFIKQEIQKGVKAQLSQFTQERERADRQSSFMNEVNAHISANPDDAKVFDRFADIVNQDKDLAAYWCQQKNPVEYAVNYIKNLDNRNAEYESMGKKIEVKRAAEPVLEKEKPKPPLSLASKGNGSTFDFSGDEDDLGQFLQEI